MNSKQLTGVLVSLVVLGCVAGVWLARSQDPETRPAKPDMTKPDAVETARVALSVDTDSGPGKNLIKTPVGKWGITRVETNTSLEGSSDRDHVILDNGKVWTFAYGVVAFDWVGVSEAAPQAVLFRGTECWACDALPALYFVAASTGDVAQVALPGEYSGRDEGDEEAETGAVALPLEVQTVFVGRCSNVNGPAELLNLTEQPRTGTKSWHRLTVGADGKVARQDLPGDAFSLTQVRARVATGGGCRELAGDHY